jgi:hypothetical protein
VFGGFPQIVLGAGLLGDFFVLEFLFAKPDKPFYFGGVYHNHRQQGKKQQIPRDSRRNAQIYYIDKHRGDRSGKQYFYKKYRIVFKKEFK